MKANQVKIIKIQRQRGRQYRITFDDNSEIQIMESMYFSISWHEGDIVSRTERDRVMTRDQEERAKEKALLLLSYRKRSRQELKRRLVESHFGTNIVESVLQTLDEKGYIDDEDFALSLARDKVRNTTAGPRKLEQELARHHLPNDVIQTVIQKVYDEFPIPDLIQKLLNKRNYDLHTMKDRQRAIRYLQSKGFYTEQIITEMTL